MVRANNEHRQLRGSFSGIRGGSVENWCARWSRRDRWPRSRPHLEPLGGATLPGAVRPCYAHSKKDLPGTIWEPSRGQILEVSQIFLGRLRASKSSTRLMWRFLCRTNSEKKTWSHVKSSHVRILWYYESEKSVKNGTDDHNRVTPRTFRVVHSRVSRSGAIREDILGNSRGIPTPQRSLSRVYLPPRQGCHGPLGLGPWLPWHPKG